MNQTSDSRLHEQLGQVFGGLRAEYLGDALFDLFTAPGYWPELLSNRPCLLVGGRGSGKTTVLRGLSYLGQMKLSGPQVDEWPLIGMYLKIETSAVAAFRGSRLPPEAWASLFTHYANLTLVQSLVEFIVWREDVLGAETTLSPISLDRLSRALGLTPAFNAQELWDALEDALIDFETAINSADPISASRPSMLGRPIELLVRELQLDAQLRGKTFAFLIDEYENLSDDQQQIFNTLIKHSADNGYTFKVGMRQAGHREHRTLADQETLNEPADYSRIDITARLQGRDFDLFAKQICNDRLARVDPDSKTELRNIDELFPALSEEEEAHLLGADDYRNRIRNDLQVSGASLSLVQQFDGLNLLDACLIGYWADANGVLAIDALTSFIEHPAPWTHRRSNYQHAMLFTFKRGKRGISKYYSGWNTFLQLANGNMRFLLLLISDSLRRHVDLGKDLRVPVSAKEQTLAAQEIGRRQVEQLPSQAASGVELTRLVLGLGRIFQVMAKQPQGHAPEVNQFTVDAAPSGHVRELLAGGVMHLALTRFEGDKMAASSGETRDFDYQLHPVYSPFFGYSHRKKRRMTIQGVELLDLTRDPAATISKVLSRSNRTVDEELPEQLVLFKDYYGQSIS